MAQVTSVALRTTSNHHVRSRSRSRQKSVSAGISSAKLRSSSKACGPRRRQNYVCEVQAPKQNLMKRQVKERDKDTDADKQKWLQKLSRLQPEEVSAFAVAAALEYFQQGDTVDAKLGYIAFQQRQAEAKCSALQQDCGPRERIRKLSAAMSANPNKAEN